MNSLELNFSKGLEKPNKGFYLDHSNFFTILLVSVIIFELLTVTLLSSFPLKVMIKKVTTPLSLNDSKRLMIAELPVNKPEYYIDYFPKVDTFDVSILKQPVKENVNNALSWFKEKGIKDICQIKVIWDTPGYLGNISKPSDFPSCK